MKTLNEMSRNQLTYLKQKWSAEVTELDRQSVRNRQRLEQRMSRQEVNQVELESLKDKLTKAQELLAHLTTTDAPQAMIDNQQALVTELSESVAAESSGTNVLTDEEAFLEQANIDQIQLQRQYRVDKITDINELLTATD